MRDRVGPAVSAPAPVGNLALLPLDAAIDAWAVGAGASAAMEPSASADVIGLCDRASAEPPARAAALAPRLVEGAQLRGARSDVGVEGAAAIARLLQHAGPELPKEAVARWARWAWQGASALAPVLAGAVLDRARRGGPDLAALLDLIGELAERDGDTWREYAVEPVREALVDGMIAIAALHEQTAGAWRLATRWPPGRTALSALIAATAAPLPMATVARVASRYAAGGQLRRAAEAALWAWAERHQDAGVTRWLVVESADVAAWPRARATVPPDLWPEVRRAAMGEILAGHADHDWLIEAAEAEPDAVGALADLVAVAYGRPRLEQAASTALRARDPLAALERTAVALQRALSEVDLPQAAPALRRRVAELRAAASAAGEPGLAEGVLALLRRESGLAPVGGGRVISKRAR